MFSEDFNGSWYGLWDHEDIDDDGNKFVISGTFTRSYSDFGGQLTPDNYIISPEILLNGATNLKLKYDVGGAPILFNEHYTVYVSKGNLVADFLNTDTTYTYSFSENLGGDPLANGAFVGREKNITGLDLNGATSVYIAFRHHDTNLGQWYINFDNVELTDAALGIEDNVFTGFKIFVDSKNVLNLSTSNKTLDGITIFNLLGQSVLSDKLSSTSASINISGLHSGVYIAQVNIDGTINSFKILRK